MDKEVVQRYALNKDGKDREWGRKNKGAEGGVNALREGGDGRKWTRWQTKLTALSTVAPRQNFFV